MDCEPGRLILEDTYIMMPLRYLEDVVDLALDVEICIGCGLCVEVCPHAVFSLEQGRARLVDQGACMECGACALNCPVAAISVDAGVGCAAAVLRGFLSGSEACCAGADDSGGSCCA